MELDVSYHTSITQQDYDGALRQNCEKCIVARAIRRLVPADARVSVCSPNRVWVNDTLFRVTTGYDIIDDFDSGTSPENLVGRTLVIQRP